ncbi:hypothetical protein RLQ69_000400 [Campylobacter jejuni]|uniref:XRE family transcriptional regulator n=1 Tax=Campylobacter jejuni TaxID=197 RepID=A0A690V6V8_CAMJU|nr:MULTISPECIES: hypothetical protein [Campylobacter]EAH6040074.1 hypothetical protein [Campylobacter coli]EAI4846036.1 hypothetical protein [Campylobacter jejuni]EAI6346091.1 hypothetical protein [Campylobacter jejuni]EAI7240949.1 hypothetical protein [Campylobacter coli]EAI8595455.1 hypothetical protein [Campylobacter jejuni]
MLKEYFKNHSINIKAFAKQHNLHYVTLFKVINGELTGERNTKGNTKAVFEKLLELGIINELPQGLK